METRGRAVVRACALQPYRQEYRRNCDSGKKCRGSANYEWKDKKPWNAEAISVHSLRRSEKREDTLTGYLFKDEKRSRCIFIPFQKRFKVYRYKIPRTGWKKQLCSCETELLTGRTHQIRAHFASIGHPLLGDGKYGDNRVNKRMRFSRQALYSYSVMFNFKTDGGALQYLNGKKFTLPYMPFEDFFKN